LLDTGGLRDYYRCTVLHHPGQIPNEPSALERIEAELDIRLLPVWLQAWEINEWDLAIVGP
jgi:hypothetical protein